MGRWLERTFTDTALTTLSTDKSPDESLRIKTKPPTGGRDVNGLAQMSKPQATSFAPVQAVGNLEAGT